MKTREASLNSLFSPGDVIEGIKLYPLRESERFSNDFIALRETNSPINHTQEPVFMRWDTHPPRQLSDWKPNDGMMNPMISDRVLTSQSTHTNPILMLEGYNIPTGSLLAIRAKMLNASKTDTQIFFHTQPQRFAGPVTLSYLDKEQTFQIRYSSILGLFQPGERITAIRLDPTPVPNNRFSIKWIELIGFKE